MTGFLLALGLLLTHAGTIVLSWFGRTADAKRAYQRELSKSDRLVNGLCNYQRRHPTATMKDYQQYLKSLPWKPAPARKARSLEVPFYFAAAICLSFWVILVYHAFVRWHHQPAYGWLWSYTSFAVLSLLWWYWALMEAKFILPAYARDNPGRQLVPPLPER